MSNNTVRLTSGGTVQVRTGVLRGVGPTGAAGSAGSAATIAVGTVTTGSAGSSATVTNAGTSSAAVFNFSIPQGNTGATGTSVYVGSGAPTSSPPAPTSSNNGDVYMDYTNKNIYLKVSGSWALQGSFGGGSTGPTGAGYDGITSTTSYAIPTSTGNQVFAFSAIGAYAVGNRVRLAYPTAPVNFVEGIITAVSSLNVTVNVDTWGGTGTYASWKVSLAGVKGSSGVQSYANAAAASATFYTSTNTGGAITNGTIYLQQDTNTMYVYLWDGTTGTTSVLSTVNISSSAAPTTGTYPYGSMWVQY